jgi:hypothetical protein
MGQNISHNTDLNYEDIQTILKNPEIYILINTLPVNQQQCLIPYTVPIEDEERLINKVLKENIDANIVIYGKNCNDDSVTKKYSQLLSFGFKNVYKYMGGMFEWLLLQDIYGDKMFPTTKKELDLLKFKPPQILNIRLLKF